MLIDDKFPNGFTDLGKYIHKKGLYMGITASAGDKSCNGLAGSLGYETIDA
jgi:alpha-galactosidase